MLGFAMRWVISAAGLALASLVLPGVSIDGGVTLFLAALVLGFVNAFVRPLLVLVTLPLTVLTLGLFLLVVNGLMIALVAALFDGFRVAGFGSAILAAILVSITSGIGSWLSGASGVRVVVVKR
jgi:putative membrane protein